MRQRGGSYNFDFSKLEPKKVLETISPIQKKIIEITFSNNIVNSNTVDHPYFVIGKGWVSFSPDDTFKKYGFKVGKFEKRDKCYLFDNSKLIEIEVIDYKVINGKFQTFNLSKIEDNHNFFANGILVHNKH